MFKKITAGVATLALSVGIISTANAAELTQSSSTIQKPTQVNHSSLITPFAASIYVTKTDYIEKGKPIPSTYFTTEERNGNKYGGNIPLVKTEDYSSKFYKVTYAGNIPRFFE